MGGNGMCATFTPTWTPTATPTQPGVPTPTAAPFEDAAGAQACHDNFDNDFNGLTDCEDPVCFGVFPCPAPVPAVSAPVGFTLAGGLALAGVIALARARRRSK
jgi:hypothetical protein